jgi:DNA-binding HxlR family transcriptional regulator
MKPSVDQSSNFCPSNTVLDIFSSKWSVLVLCALSSGTLRYSELQKQLEGISQKMLTQTLRELEQNGVVQRKVFPVVPPHTEYSMTELGQGLNEILGQINAWARSNLETVLEARSQFAVRQVSDR